MGGFIREIKQQKAAVVAVKAVLQKKHVSGTRGLGHAESFEEDFMEVQLNLSQDAVVLGLLSLPPHLSCASIKVHVAL